MALYVTLAACREGACRYNAAMLNALVLLALTAAASAQQSVPDSPPPDAPALLARCIACHGADGRSRTAAAPHIGGQSELYLIWALNQYRRGLREGDVMNHAGKDMSDENIEALAHWYSQRIWPAYRNLTEESEQ